VGCPRPPRSNEVAGVQFPAVAIDAGWATAHDRKKTGKGISLVLTRRMFLTLIASTISMVPAVRSWSKDGEGHDDGGGDDGGDHDDDGGGDGRDDDGGGDDGGNDDGGDKGREREKKREDDQLSQDDALRERELGTLIPLETALRIAGARVRGRVIDVNLAIRGNKPQYRVKVRRDDGVIKTIRLDARTGRVISFLGF
jgi:hypothetical protein